MGEKVGELYYDVTLETGKMIDGQRAVDRELGKTTGSLDRFDGKLTQTAQAVKIHALALEVAAASSKRVTAASTELASASDKVAAAQKKAAEEAAKAAAAMDKGGISAKQLTAATRGIPAQFTDIATSLAAGQNPFQVLLQQGGQLKDMFGGVGPAAKALGGYVMGLISPLTIGAAAVGTFLVGLVKGEQEMQEVSRTLELGGQRAGVTAGQVNALAAEMDNLAGVTRGKAAESLTVFAAVGISGEQSIAKFTAAAIRLEQAGGPAVAETAKAFKDLETSPLQASLKLNESVNFLTESLYRQIKTLQQQGKTAEAAAVAQNAYADAINNRTPKIMENLGLMERGWRGIANVAKEAWDAILNIGRSESPEKKIDAVREKMAALQKQIASGGFSTTEGGAATGLGLSQQALAQKQAELAALQEQVRMYELSKAAAEGSAQADAKRAQQLRSIAEFDQAGERFLTQRAQMEREIEQARNLGVAAGKSEVEIEQRILAIRRSYAGMFAKSDSAQAYYQGLVAQNQIALAKIDAAERKELADNKARMTQDAENSAIYLRARTEIVAKFARDRARLEEKTAQEVADLKIAITTDEAAKVELVLQESIRRADAAQRVGTMTHAEAERAKTLATATAETQRADLRERNARAAADAILSQTKSQEQQILLVRDEAVRQAEEAYRRGQITFIEAEAKKVEAAVTAADKLKALQTSRSNTVVGTLEMRAGTTGNLDDQVAAIRAQADAQLAAAQEAQSRDLEQTQIYADRKAAIIADMNQKIIDAEAASARAQYSMLGQATDQLLALLQQSGKEKTAIGKAAFLASKALAVAEIIMNTEVAAAKAQGQLGIYGIPMATIIKAAGYASAGMVAGMAIGQVAGGRQYGGPVSSGSLYRVNEAGAPEMFTGSNGNQYMLPTKSGNVTPADQAGGGGVEWKIVVHNNMPGAAVTPSVDQQSRTVNIAVAEVASQISNNSGPVWSAMRGSTNVKGKL